LLLSQIPLNPERPFPIVALVNMVPPLLLPSVFPVFLPIQIPSFPLLVFSRNTTGLPGILHQKADYPFFLFDLIASTPGYLASSLFPPFSQGRKFYLVTFPPFSFLCRSELLSSNIVWFVPLLFYFWPSFTLHHFWPAVSLSHF